MRNRNKGFTLIELIVVVIIVAILAAVAIPLMTGNVAKARRSEGMAGLDTIRVAERMYYQENTAYASFASGALDTSPLNGYLAASDMNGTCFNSLNYSVTGGGATFVAKATCRTNAGSGTINMDQVGVYNGY